MTDDEIKNPTRISAQVLKARKLGTSEVVQLVFLASTLPEHVFVGYTRCKVFPCIEKLRQCKKCNRFDHIASTCLMPLRCDRCGKAHEREKFTADEPRCLNCKKGHESTFRRSPFFQTEEAISKHKSENRVSYVSARKVIARDSTRKMQRSKHVRSEAGTGVNATKETPKIAVPEDSPKKDMDQKDCARELIRNDTNFPPLPPHPGQAALGKSSEHQRLGSNTSRADTPNNDSSPRNVGTTL